ncbi:hypothetical protein CKO28_23355 [Rhodovibrio sodomensis]|uniref:DUF4202 domain-containing protein n=1 Tax=Rhodovibrio sodomensis TaxID=1088 RepID=A0ABS1DN85_9PROT|nr:DUF4202 domain-containing protein [Rhodovibrio sodomensis]MBK1670953.1 hypothetical protein [Rhodovibrio sodomensis]
MRHAPDRFTQAIAAIDRVNMEDPGTEWLDGAPVPRGLAYGRRMTGWVERLNPDASQALRLAARAQHIRRWEIPRDRYPGGRDGYLRWRTHLKRHHARVASEVLADIGYDADTIARVRDLLRKRGVKTDPETQTLEDAACLVFLENGLVDFARKHDSGKVTGILRKTWTKMSEAGRREALQLDLPEAARALVADALA